ncbi:MAG: DUF3800 domain-containing protein [Solirubrobacteraceae bacterium]
MSTRILYIDDSGKPDRRHASKAVVLAGFAVNAEDYGTLARRILGAKKAFYPGRGLPHSWEIKSPEIIKPNPWKRAKNRSFCDEIVRLLTAMGTTTYAATIDKNSMKHALTLATSMPLQLQILAEHFAAECQALGRTGMLISDWSGHEHDQHASQCVASYVSSCNLPLHPGVYYGSSHSIVGIQAADLIAGIRRRVTEGDRNLDELDEALSAVRAGQVTRCTCKGRVQANRISVF